MRDSLPSARCSTAHCGGSNSDYKITVWPAPITNGTDPLHLCAALSHAADALVSEGSTLLVIYVTAAFLPPLYVHPPGPHASDRQHDHNQQPEPYVPFHTIIKQTRFGATARPMQPVSVSSLNGEMTLLGPSAVSRLFQIKGPGSTVNTNSDWNGGDGLTLEQFVGPRTHKPDAFVHASTGPQP